jgi:hypothetical protein
MAIVMLMTAIVWKRLSLNAVKCVLQNNSIALMALAKKINSILASYQKKIDRFYTKTRLFNVNLLSIMIIENRILDNWFETL